MVRALEQIERELAELEQAIAQLGQEFYQTYQQYLDALGLAMRQQLIRAGYHLCTQAYPESFLQFSLNQRQQLQQTLLKVASNAQEQLRQQLQPFNAAYPAQAAVDISPDGDATPSTELPDLPHLLLLSTAASLPQVPESQSTAQDLTPSQALKRWQETLEAAIVRSLHQASWEANRLLKKSGLLPPQLPEPLLEMATKTESIPETVAGPPNILDITVEAIRESSAEKTKPEEAALLPSLPLRFVAIHLRLSEIEFAEAALLTGRTQIRTLLAQLQKLDRQYAKKIKERAIVAAEEAWRSSWVDH
jgi:hypothetical protein